MEKPSINPMHARFQSPRCTARVKRTLQPCRAPAVLGWRVCRMHGARAGAPTGKSNGRYRHGGRTREAIEERRAISKLIREARASLADLE
jgi:hypothetical protein